MVQIINLGPSKAALQADVLSKTLAPALQSGLDNFTTSYFINKKMSELENDPELAKKPRAEKLSAIQRALAPYGQKGKEYFETRMQIEKERRQERQQQQENSLVNKLFKGEEISDKDLEGTRPELQIMAKKAMTPKAAPGGLGGQPVPPDVVNKIEEINKNNPDATSGQLKMMYDKAGIYPAASMPYVENKQKQEELDAKKTAKRESDLSKEVVPLKQKIIDRANLARESIASKESQIDLIKRGKLDDPTVAAFLDKLPFNMGKRFLSPDTVEYRAGLVDNFKDLKTIFSGPARVKEIEIMEGKIADIYLTDAQKLQMLGSRIDVSRIDLAREEAAEEVERLMPNATGIQFNREMEKRTKEKMDTIGKYVIGEQRAIIDAAERRKELPLNPDDPDDKQIMAQILKEAGGDKQKARQIATKKGYKF